MKKSKKKKYKKRIAELEEQLEEMQERYDAVHDMMQMTSAHLRGIQEKLQKSKKHIVDSINYAHRVQTAILDSKEKTLEVFPESFILHRPKDVLSGDFYWFKKSMGLPFVAAIDCTGHGVPASMLTVLALSLINQVVTVFGITDPAEILLQLDSMLWQYTRGGNKDERIRDGMDMVICNYDDTTKELTAAGAHRPLYLIRDGELETYSGAKYSLGSNNERSRLLKNHVIPIEEGDMVYLFSDGFPDQFGGPNKRKYMVGKFKKLLVKIAALPLKQQEEVLANTLDEWKGDQVQTDDILVIGLRF